MVSTATDIYTYLHLLSLTYALPTYAADHQQRRVIWVGQCVFGQPSSRRCFGFERETGTDLGLFLAGADQIGVGAQPDRQTDRIDQDRLAGTGLASQHGEEIGRASCRERVCQYV